MSISDSNIPHLPTSERTTGGEDWELRPDGEAQGATGSTGVLGHAGGPTDDGPDFLQVPRPLSEIVRAEGQLVDRIAYHRAYEYEQALVERAYECPEHGVDHELEALREQTAPMRRRVEAIYTAPGDLGPYTELEVGMLQGKLSALRWVLGRHWDFLTLT